VTALYKVSFSTSTGRWSDQYYFTSWPVLLTMGDQYWSDRWPVLVAFAPCGTQRRDGP